MSEPRVIWSGTYAGYAVDVRIVGGVPVPFLDGRRSMLPGDRDGIARAAVVELAAERDAALAQLESMRAKRQDVIDGMTRAIEAEGRANKACAEMQLERDELRERVGKLQAEVNAHRMVMELSARTASETHADQVATIDSLAAQRDVLLERLVMIEGPAQRLVDIDNNLSEGRDTAAKASFHDAVMRPIEELRGYFAKLHRAEQQRDALRERLAKLESEASANGEALRERLAKLNTMLENAEECPTRPFSGCICCKAFAQIKERVW